MGRKKSIPLCTNLEELSSTYLPKPTAEQKRKTKEDDEKLAASSGQDKSSIKLRGKKLKSSISLYIDQIQNGKHTYEYLKMYLNIEVNTDVQSQNVTTMALANELLSRKRTDLLVKGAGITPKKRSKANLQAYIEKLADEQLKRTGNKHSYFYILQALAKHLSTYKGESITLSDVDVNFCKGFIKYLHDDATNGNFNRKHPNKKAKTKLTENHQHHLIAKLNYVLGCAVEDGLIQSNPILSIKSEQKRRNIKILPKEEDGNRDFLSIEEIKRLYDTDCADKDIKESFLFCCFVGLRFSDVSQLKWENLTIDKKSGAMILDITMQKLKHLSSKVNHLKVPISSEAQKWLPNRANDKDLVFPGLKDDETTNIQLRKWIAKAGIDKHITFHCSRHTAATLNITLGVPIAKVAKLMGHSKISTTQIYEHLLGIDTVEDVELQNSIFDKKL